MFKDWKKVSIFLHKNILVSYNIKTIYMSEIKFNYTIIEKNNIPKGKSALKKRKINQRVSWREKISDTIIVKREPEIHNSRNELLEGFGSLLNEPQPMDFNCGMYSSIDFKSSINEEILFNYK